MPTIKLRGIDLYYETHGAGQPLVLIQGLGLDSGAWSAQITSLSRRHRIICFDNRGIGRTVAPEQLHSTSEMADDLIALLDALQIQRADILGFSLGGCIAQSLALRYPDRVNRLILVSTAAKFPALTLQVIQTWSSMLQEVRDGRMNPKLYIKAQLPWIFTDTFFQDHQQIETLIGDALAYPYQPTVTGFANQVAACVAHDSLKQLHQIQTPTLILVGEADLLTPVALAQTLSAKLPNAELKVIAGAGHNFFWEVSAAFNQAVLDFTSSEASD
ncbi:alpha/beta fold hydrolase [Leptolyngbya sp. NK1-12]|uniref:Alpha/beta fold hydrolase n=1 Tax=Leptolyngbya sp. NK1-12 TaxID=2547451 RepID=A0AA97AIU2_9CYAN|nr:alpha/beta fold hydrolase [Leptolyngbya sp. NK1-12]